MLRREDNLKKFVSTGGLKSYDRILKLCENLSDDFGIELSATPELEVSALIDNFQNRMFSLHNYTNFDTPLVLNVASAISSCERQSLELIEKNIRRQSELGMKFFSFHAGYMLEPRICDLGGKIAVADSAKIEKGEYMERFIRNVNYLSDFASSFGIQIFIENNVLTKENLENWGENLLMLTNPQNSKTLVEKLDSSVGFLIDFGHLNVSSETECFDCAEFISVFEERDLAYHISNNNGLVDQNLMISSGDWYWPYINSRGKFITAEVYDFSDSDLDDMEEIMREGPN